MVEKRALVGIVCGSTSDLGVLEDAFRTLDELEIHYSVDVKSAHRMPEEMVRYAKEVEGKGLKVVIVAAGGAVDLSGMIAAFTLIPIIAIPVKSPDLSGIDSLLSMVQMPNGVPVATVGINRARNAAIYAAEILALFDEKIMERLRAYRKTLTSSTRLDAGKKLTEVRRSGTHPYLV